MLYRAIALVVFLSVLVLPAASGARPYPRGKPFHIGFVTDGPGPTSSAFIQRIKKEVGALVAGEFEVAFPADKLVHGDRTNKGIAVATERLLAEPGVQLVIGVGPLASHLLARRERLPRAAIACHVVDPAAQGVPLERGKSGKTNLTYITSTLDIARAIRGFRRLIAFKHLTVLLPRGYGDAFPSIGLKVQKKMAALGVKISWLEVRGPLERVASRIPRDSDGVVLLMPPGSRRVSVDRLVPRLNRRGLPSFSPFAAGPVRRGFLAGYGMEHNAERVARRVALNVQRVLMGEDPATFGVKVSFGSPVLHLNMKTANAIGYRPGWDVLSEAVRIGRKRAARPSALPLDLAIRQAVKTNLTVIGAHKDVAAGIHEVRRNLARWAPAIGLSASAAFIDSDRAQASFGSAHERSVTGGVQLSQLLFSEPALAGVTIQRRLQRGREQELERVKLDVMAAVATAYVNLLRARAAERLQKENLKVTKKHLELAMVRQSVGSSSMADVHRWETRLANDKRAVINAIAARNQAEIALNALRRRPLEQPFRVPDDALRGKHGWGPGKRIQRYIGNPWDFAVMRRFMVREGLRESPELARLDHSIAAQKRALLSSKLDFFVPSLAFQFNLDHRLHGSPEAQGLSIPGVGSFPRADETSWTAAFALSWPLFEGSAKIHRYNQARVELSRLKTRRAEAAQQIEQGIRAAMHRAGASYPGIKLSAEAAEAAHKSLKIVAEAYARGATSVIDLIEAQNGRLGADLAAAVAEYDFYTDLISAMRAIGNRDFFLHDEDDEDDEDSWFDRLDRFTRQTRKGG